MVKHYRRQELIDAVRLIISGGPYPAITRGNGRAGNLIENLLGIQGGNFDVADAVGYELKTSLSPNTPTTLFHKDPLPRGRGMNGAVTRLVHQYGWPSQHREHEVLSFRATIYGTWTSRDGMILKIQADSETVRLQNGEEIIAYWDSNTLVTAAAAKLRNMMYVIARASSETDIEFISANLLEGFQSLRFIDALNHGYIAIDFDARTIPGKSTVRNHGTKFRIREKDFEKIYSTSMKL